MDHTLYYTSLLFIHAIFNKWATHLRRPQTGFATEVLPSKGS